MAKGYIISIEGIDQSGKKTQSYLLSKKLKSEFSKVRQLSFPDYSTTIGDEIRFFLEGKKKYNRQAFHMLLSLNRWEYKEKIEKWLDSENIVIINRYSGSNYAYGKAHGLSLDWLFNLEKGLPKSSLTILIDIDPNISINRKISKRDILEKNLFFLKKVRNNYLELAFNLGWKILNGDKDPELLNNDIHNIVINFFRNSLNS